MKEFDKIIGYAGIKEELEQIADMIRNSEKYDRLGVSLPTGVLLHGDPGVGKSLMASSLIKACGLTHYVCRKDKPNGDFINFIKKSFNKAAEHAPSIILLDDMDKFANGDERHPDSEEYVTVQSCIDEIKGKNVLVLATANNLNCLPESLLRVGRFDRTIEVPSPNSGDAEKIIKHYLSKKKISEKLDYNSIAKLMSHHSCAELETVINEAGVYAGFDNAESIEMQHFLKAVMRTLCNVPAAAFEEFEENEQSYSHMLKIAYHEAGHALVHEVMDPGSISLISIYGSQYSSDSMGGITMFRHNDLIDSFHKTEIDIISALAGKAALEQKFGILDIGCSGDINTAFNNVKRLISDLCVNGFGFYRTYNSSESLILSIEKAAVSEIEKYYRKAKELVCTNLDFYNKLAETLAKNKILCSADILKIRESLHIN